MLLSSKLSDTLVIQHKFYTSIIVIVAFDAVIYTACPKLLATYFWLVLAQSWKQHTSIIFKECVVQGLNFSSGDF